MEGIGSFFEQRTRNTWNSDALKNFSSLSPAVQRHLQKVYITLTGALLVSAVGVYVHIIFHMGGLLSLIGTIGSMVWLSATPPTRVEEGTSTKFMTFTGYQRTAPQALPDHADSIQNKRLGLLAATALFQGLSIGTIVEVALNMDPGIVVTALLGTVAVFACFTGAALVARRREYLYLGALLSSALSVMATMRFASFFVGGSASIFQLELYGGLLVFVGYILFDTQMIVERASQGNMDYIRHALDLFVDFVAILVRLLVILMKNSQSQNKKKNDKEKSRASTHRR